jgi:N-formylglutamate deformylase
VSDFSSISDFPDRVVLTAIHAGHQLRPSLASLTAVDDATRFREEDPFTDQLTHAGESRVVVHRSRFEVDLNRPPDGAVYVEPEDAWGLELWRTPLPESEIEQSLRAYETFHDELATRLDPLAQQGPFVLLDLHSYNHRRDGAEHAAAPPAENPEINIGTGSLDRGAWAPLVDDFVADLQSRRVAGHPLDVGENVRFRGGHLSRWVNERYEGVGCALAIEFKKVFMDEWTGTPDRSHISQLTEALRRALPVLRRHLADRDG